MTCHWLFFLFFFFLKVTHFEVNFAASIPTLTSLAKGRLEGRYSDWKSCRNYELQEARWRENLSSSSSSSIAEYWMEGGEAGGWSQEENWKWRQPLFSLAAGPGAPPQSIRVDRISGAGGCDGSERHGRTGSPHRRCRNISQVVGAPQEKWKRFHSSGAKLTMPSGTTHW